MRRSLLIETLVAISAAVVLQSCSSESDNADLAILNTTLIDAVNGVRSGQTVLIDDGEIVAILSGGEAVEADAVIDGEGRYLIPGLWDFHVHLTYDPRLTEAMPALFLSWGITSVRDTGGLLENVVPAVESMRAEGAVAPRVYFAGPLLDGEYVVYDGDGRPEIGVQVATPADARATVRRLYDAGVDFVKVYEMISPEVFQALVDTARELGLPIDSHVPLSMRARDAGPGVDSIEHLRNIELDCASDAASLHAERLALLQNPDSRSGGELRSLMHSTQRMPAIERYDEAQCDAVIAALDSTLMVPTLRLNAIEHAPPYLRSDWDESLRRLPASVGAEWSAQAQAEMADTSRGPTAFGDWSLFLSGRMHAAGVSFGAGTDTPIDLSIPGYSLHEELEMLVRAGLTPLEAIEAATVNPAIYFGIQDTLGTIDVGKQADLVLLDGDPLSDISNTRRIDRVVSRGKVVE